MSKHGSALPLSGDCVVVPDNICMPFKEFCIHTLLNSPAVGQPTNPQAGSFGCAANVSNLGTQYLPEPKIPSVINRAPVYGRTLNTVQLETFFNSSDLAPWRSRKIFGPSDPYNKMTSGPAIQQGHMVTEVRRRLRPPTAMNNDNYQNRFDFYFTDSNTPINGMDDWCKFLHPASFFWTNKQLSTGGTFPNEPFKAVDFYEDCGEVPIVTDSFNRNFIPFCSPMNVRDEAGSVIGQYVGYTAIFYFGFAYMRKPYRKYLPNDYYINPQPPTPVKVVTTNQFFSVDCHIYMVANSSSPGVLKSPKLQSVRYWFYNKFGTTYNVCSPYFYIIHGDFTSQWNFDVAFNLVGGGTETIKFGLSNLQVYATP